MKQNLNNPYRWVADGQPFYPIGLQDCTPGNGASGYPVLSYWGFDGGYAPNNNSVDLDTYLTAHKAAGFNFYRWSIGNCSFNLDSEFRWSEGDILIGRLKQYGFRVQLVFFNNYVDTSPNGLAYVRRVIDRYGSKVDIWEVSNESQSPDADLILIANYIKANDPNRHPVTTSLNYPSPQGRNIAGMDIISPHLYSYAGEFDIDRETYDKIINWKMQGKPIIIGEYGYALVNYDATTDLKARLATWSAFFAEGSIVFWNTSVYKGYSSIGSSNAYLGPTTRSYIKLLTDFTKDVPQDAQIANIVVNNPSLVRAFALGSSSKYFAYIHAYTNHTTPTSGITVTINVQRAGTATWINPSTGAVLGTQSVSAGVQTLNVPSFLIDVALKIF